MHSYYRVCDLKQVHGTLRAARWSRSSKASFRNKQIVFKKIYDDGLSKIIMKDEESSLFSLSIPYFCLIRLYFGHFNKE